MVNIWISNQSVFLAESREERGWLNCFKLRPYHFALDQWLPHRPPRRSNSNTVSDVQGGVCKELYATFEIAELRVNKQVFHHEMSYQWNTVNHYRAHREQSPICVISSWFDTVTKSIHKFSYLFIAFSWYVFQEKKVNAL